MIEEKYIEQHLSNLETEVDNSFLQEEEILAYLRSEYFDPLTQIEKDTLLFCMETIFHSFKIANEQSPEFDFDKFQELEEANWKIREETNNWSATLDKYFEQTNETDLLAFVEDVLVEDEDQPISNIAKEVIFVTCKSYVEAITA